MKLGDVWSVRTIGIIGMIMPKDTASMTSVAKRIGKTPFFICPRKMPQAVAIEDKNITDCYSESVKYAFAILGLGCLVVLAGLFLMNQKQEYAQTKKENTMNQHGTLMLTSSAFREGAPIPAKYTCDGERFTSPPLSITGVPEGTQSLVLIMEDPDVPKEFIPSGIFDHWVLYAISPDTREIPEGAEGVGTAGANSRDDLSYTGPCPPEGTHRYFFKLYALSGVLNFIKAPTKDEVVQAIQGMILDETELMGRYERP
jgi:Raf kinase inhibitor-like YbhB/YbcL family protein